MERMNRGGREGAAWMSGLLALTLLAGLPGLASSLDEPAVPVVRVAAGQALVAAPSGLESPGDLVIEGDLLAAPGADLVLRAARDIIVSGRVLGAPGAPGDAGRDVRILAGGAVVLRDGSVVQAGAGGHGVPAVVPGGLAVGGDGGPGGSVLLEAPSAILDGDVLPGAGGRGGDAYGATALGGDGGPSGALWVNGAQVPASGLGANPAAPTTLPDLLPLYGILSCGVVAVDTKPPALPTTSGPGAAGGNACAHGSSGSSGGLGADGPDDDCGTCGTNNHPICPNYGTLASGGPHGSHSHPTHNGQKAQHGGGFGQTASLVSPGYFDRNPTQPGVGGAATAVGGKGGDVLADSGSQAGSGGSAAATGGAGGNGGNGGMGGHAALFGNACSGGNGGNGAIGGTAAATGGAQGLNVLNCLKNGNSGTASASGGPGGSGGSGGGGGGSNWPWSSGGPGSNGYGGSAGTATNTVPPTVPCPPPGAPTVSAVPAFLSCSQIVLTLTASPNPTATAKYEVQRSTSVSFSSYVPFDVVNNPLTAPSQVKVDSGLLGSTTYYYRAKSVNVANQYSSFSNVASATTMACVPIGPIGGLVKGGILPNPITAPTLAAVPGGLGTILVTISPPVNPGGPILSYSLHRGLVTGGPYPTTYTVPYPNNLPQTYGDGGLAPLTTYCYIVEAVLATGPGPSSNEACATTPLMATGGGGRDATLRWQRSEAGAVTTRECLVDMQVDFAVLPGGFALTKVATNGRSNPLSPAASEAFCRDLGLMQNQVILGKPVDPRESRCGPAVPALNFCTNPDAGGAACALKPEYELLYDSAYYFLLQNENRCQGALVQTESATISASAAVRGLRFAHTVTTYPAPGVMETVTLEAPLNPRPESLPLACQQTWNGVVLSTFPCPLPPSVNTCDGVGVGWWGVQVDGLGLASHDLMTVSGALACTAGSVSATATLQAVGPIASGTDTMAGAVPGQLPTCVRTGGTLPSDATTKWSVVCADP